MEAGVTRHAQARMQQRGIGADAVEALLECGREAFDHRGGVVLYFDKAARRRIARQARVKDLEKLARSYAVISTDGELLTVGHRYRRIGR